VSDSPNNRFASGLPPAPGREGHPPGPARLLSDQKGKGFGDTNPEAGPILFAPSRKEGGSPFAERHLIRIALTIATALIAVSVAILASCLPAHAAGSGMPWETPLQKILASIEGPVAKVSAVIIIIVTGLSLAFGDVSGGFRKLVQVVFGLSIAFAATSFFLSFFSFAGGALIE
jgi:type IV secretion system protein TrbC